jgi:ring-1,2-phenylacetyl-CoA epoxidase subunit PaaC
MTKDDQVVADAGFGVDNSTLKFEYYATVKNLLRECELQIPEVEYFQKGGKKGIHSEHMGYILSEMQFMQRTYPDMKW